MFDEVREVCLYCLYSSQLTRYKYTAVHGEYRYKMLIDRLLTQCFHAKQPKDSLKKNYGLCLNHFLTQIDDTYVHCYVS